MLFNKDKLWHAINIKFFVTDTFGACSVRLLRLSLEDCRRPKHCIHLESGLPKRHFCLNDCGRSFGTLNSMISHVRFECENDPEPCTNYMCHKCGRAFRFKSTLHKHLASVCQEPNKFSCPYCSYSARLSCHVKAHLRRKHPYDNVLVLDTVEKSEQPTMYYCRYCNYMSEKSINVRVHTAQDHPTMRIYVCTEPQKVKTFPCGNCSSVFIHKWSLYNHQKNVCGRSPGYKCPHCTYKSYYKENVLRHVRVMHPGESIYVVDMRKPDSMLVKMKTLRELLETV